MEKLRALNWSSHIRAPGGQHDYFLLLAIVGILVAGVCGSLAADYRAMEVEATDGVIKCLWARTEYLVSHATGPCDTFEPPTRIAIGEGFKANGERREIRFIIATQAEKEMNLGEVHIRRGQWTCVAGETAKDLDFEDDTRTAVWLYVENCKPTK